MTSRDQLTGLVAAEAAQPLTWTCCPRRRLGELLARRIGADRVAAEPDAVDEIIAPVRPAAAGAGDRGGPRRDRPRLPARRAGGASCATPDPRSTRWTRGEPARRPRGVLLVVPGPERRTRRGCSGCWACIRARTCRAAAAASLAGLPPRRGTPLLAELARANLVTEHGPGRYAMHDLLRAYAADVVDGRRLDRRTRGTPRSTACSTTTCTRAYAAGRAAAAAAGGDRARLAPGRRRPGAADRVADASPGSPPNEPCCSPPSTQAAAIGFDAHTWQLAWALVDYFETRGHWPDRIASQNDALDAAPAPR